MMQGIIIRRPNNKDLKGYISAESDVPQSSELFGDDEQVGDNQSFQGQIRKGLAEEEGEHPPEGVISPMDKSG